MSKKRRRMPPLWYSSRDLLREADWLWWVGEYQMAWDIMHIIAERVTAEHTKEPRDGEMAREVEEGEQGEEVEFQSDLSKVAGTFFD